MHDTFSYRMKKAMEIRNLKQVDIVNATKIGKSAISQYLSGEFTPKQVNTYLIADALNVNEAWLMGFDVPMERINDNFTPPTITDDVVVFPVIGEIAAGYNTMAVESWSGDTVAIPIEYLKGRRREEFFVLSVVGESMYPLYMEGDKVLVLKQSTLNRSGEIGAVLYDDECATLKRVNYVQGEDWLELIPVNPIYPPKRIENAELERCRVMGIPWLLVRELDK